MMRKLFSLLALTFALTASAGTPELEAATNSALAAERAFIEPGPPPIVSGPTWADVETEVKASESRSHQYVTHEFATLLDALHALWSEAPPPPIDPPPVDPPDPPPVVGAIELGSSYTYPTRITPAFNGHGFTNSTSLFWNEINRTVLADRVHPESDRLIAKLGSRIVQNDFFGDHVGLESAWGIPINVVAGTHPRQAVDVLSYASESDDVPVPIPANPSIEGWKGPNLPTQADMDSGDHHLLIVVRDEATGAIAEEFDLYQAWHDAFGWHAASLSYWNIADGLPRPDGWTSGDAAGLPIVPFMATYDEVHQVGGIRHPLRITLDVGALRSRYVYPARHAALSGSGADGIAFGERLRLRADWYAAHAGEFTGEARVFVEAFRTYGVINSDIGGMGFLCGVSDDRFDDANLMTLRNIPWSAFEVLESTPAFEAVGPSTVPVGVDVSYRIKVNPDPELVGVHGFYMHAYEQGPIVAGRQTWVRLPDDSTSGIEPHHLGLDNGVVNWDFTFKARKTGPHLIEVDQAGEYKKEWTPPTMVMPGRGPFPYLQVQVQ